MQGEKFDIVFRGKLASGFDEATVRTNLARLFKKDEARIAPLFSAGRVVLKRGLDRETADKYRKAFRNAGAVVAIVQDRESASVETKPAPEKPDFGREVKAAYAGKASFQIDQGPSATDGKASFAVDQSGDPETPPDETDQAGSEDQFDALEMPGVAAPPAKIDDPPAQADAAAPMPEIDISSLSMEGETAPAALETTLENEAEGRASYVIDEGPTDSGGGMASFAVDDSAEPDTASDDSGQASAEDEFGALEMPGIAPPSVQSEVTVSVADSPDQTDAAISMPEIDTSSLSFEGETPTATPDEAVQERASYVIDEGPSDSGGGAASFAIDDAEPGDAGAESIAGSVDADDFAPLEMSASGLDDAVSELAAESLQDDKPGSGVELPSSVGDAGLSEPGAQLSKPVHLDPPQIDTSALSLSEVGVTMDESERPPTPQFDTGDLATDENYDALDETEPVATPDIDTGDMDVMEVGVTVDETERPPPADIDTSGLSTTSDYEALDEAEKPTEPDIDISQLGLEEE